MGTTQRIGSGVKNQPNWGNLTVSLTSTAKAVEELEQIEDDEVQNEKVTQRIIKLEKRKEGHVKASVNRLVKIGGGSKNISSGKSKTFGRSGIKSSSNLISFFDAVNTSGIKEALNQIGFGTIEGKKTQDVIDYLYVYCSSSSVGMDEAAANSAMFETLKNLEREVDENIESLEQLMKSYIDENKLSNILCSFFGKYIYEYLWERLEERIRQARGKEVSKLTFDSIQKEIQGRVELLNTNRPLQIINWGGNDGVMEIEKIFEAILKIEEV
jgi:hypothetical protein